MSNHEPSEERGIYAASTSVGMGTVKRHECRAPDRFMAHVCDSEILAGSQRKQERRSRQTGGWLLCLLLGSIVGAGHAQGASGVTNLLRKDFWDADGTVNSVAAANGVVYVGGSFSYVAPKGRKVAALDAYTGQTLPDFPKIFGASIRAILDDGRGGWFLGGEFNQVGGLPRTNLVHVLNDNSVDPGFHPDPNDDVFALASDGNTLYVGGDFTFIGGQPRSRLASISFSNGLVTAWSPQPDSRVATLLIAEDRIYAGGYFSSIGGLFPIMT